MANTGRRFPALDVKAIGPTRDALHAYAKVAGAWCKAGRRKRKHWWHASLRPSLTGLTTGVIRADPDFEIELDLVDSRIMLRTPAGSESEALHGQPAAQVAAYVRNTLVSAGIEAGKTPEINASDDAPHAGYAPERAEEMQFALASVAAALAEFRAGIREETSPIQLWPHHFDLSMIWLPGTKIRDQDPADEEQSDMQLNFGFTFGDASIPEPYFYVTAYPLPDAFPDLSLPAGTEWRSEGFNGAVLLYGDLVTMNDPMAYLLELWNGLLDAGDAHLSGMHDVSG